jgi:putative peptidoglycan lipid II flippase
MRVTESDSVTDAGTRHSHAAAIARGAGVIAGLTMLARIAGLVRTVVFSQAVGATCLGTAYVTANQVPNLVYELVLGGALASVMVPVLARTAERAGTDPAARAEISQVSSALLTWTFVILIPLTLVVLLGAGEIATLLNPANPSAQCVHADVIATTASMLRVFAPQALLYGLSVVLFGLLQAYRRFSGYALAPLVSSLVLIASYLAFAPLGKNLPLSRLPASAELVLSAGATLGIAALVLVGLVPTLRLGLRLRPTLRFPPGIARRAGGLVMVGVAEMVVQEISNVAVIALANGRGVTGALVIFGYASQVFNSLNAVLALSIVLSAFPVLSARDGSVFDRTCAGSTRAVLVASFLGIAVMGAVTVPAAHVLAKDPGQVSQLILSFALFAPGLAAVGVIANLSRALLALGRLKVAAAGLAGSGLLVLVAQVVMAELAPVRLVVGALALGNTLGSTGAAIPLVFVTRRIRGRAAVAGVGRATLAGLAAAVVGAAVGAGVSVVIPVDRRVLYGIVGGVASLAAIVAFGLVAFFLDDGDLRVVLARIQQVIRPGSASPATEAGPARHGARTAALSTVNLGGLAGPLRQRAHDLMLRLRTTRQVRMTNLNDQYDRRDGAAARAHLLTRRERQGALSIGIVSGGAGGYAALADKSAAGTVMLLLIALVFLLVGVEGAPLMRLIGKSGGAGPARHGRGDKAPPPRAAEEASPERPPMYLDGVPAADAGLTPASDLDGSAASIWPTGTASRLTSQSGSGSWTLPAGSSQPALPPVSSPAPTTTPGD